MIISEKQIAPIFRQLYVDGVQMTVPVYTVGTAVVGSGAAGLNCADLLALGEERSTRRECSTCSQKAGNPVSADKSSASDVSPDAVPPVAVITEGIYMGTSRNTGSDKQTYYKLTMSGGSPDSVEDMAKSYFDCGGMDGDLALCEAAGSARAFMRLVDLGVPFPYNDYGEFAGYRTDHDTRTRATSCGPLTSKYMTEALESSVRSRGVPIFDGYRVVKLLHDGRRAAGLIAICPDETANRFGICLILAENFVFATGGPSAIYASTVYPESQTCSHGVLLDAGASAVNVTESQYGIASVSFRWNLSGTYQQVIPRYFSVLPDGTDEREFLDDVFNDTPKMLTAIFRKGYQWPFDPAKLDLDSGNSSSLIDIAVYRERMSGRRVFIDFRRNPSACGEKLDPSLLESEPREYLEKSGGLLATPIERLLAMNPQAFKLYLSHGIDLSSSPLEIDVCAQHNNGGFEVDTDYRSVDFDNLFIIGEAAGVFGIKRPGGSALNSTQVGGRRASDAILCEKNRDRQISTLATESLSLGIKVIISPDGLPSHRQKPPDISKILEQRLEYGKLMSKHGAIIRNERGVREAISSVRAELDSFGKYRASSPETLRELLINRDILLTQLVYLSAIQDYISNGGKSRGSYLIADAIPDGQSKPVTDERPDEVRSVRLNSENLSVSCSARKVRPIPVRDNWFETVFAKFTKQRDR